MTQTTVMKIVVASLLLGTVLNVAALAREDWQERPLVCNPKELTSEELKKCKKWISGVEMPDVEAPCCGEADAYLADEFKENSNGEFIAVITKDYPSFVTDDGEGDFTTVPATPRGTEIIIPKNKVNSAYVDGNPTGHGIVFLSAKGRVLCYFGPTLAGVRGPQFASAGR